MGRIQGREGGREGGRVCTHLGDLLNILHLVVVRDGNVSATGHDVVELHHAELRGLTAVGKGKEGGGEEGR